jgi:hypothetical protein
MEKNRYILQWEDYCKKACEAMENNHFDVYDDLMKKADDIYKLYRQESKLTYECTNFGISNYIFEDALPSLFKTNKKVIKEFVNTIKEDKNLLNQHKFYQALKNINEHTDIHTYINEALLLVKEGIDIKTLNESNDKLSKIIKENGIRPSSEINEDVLKYFESCDFLFKNNRKLSNLPIISENINNLINYINTQTILKEDKINIYDMLENFEKKYDNILNEAEKNFVKNILTSSSDEKEHLFNNIKKECIEIINSLLESTKDEETDGLNAIKEQINEKTFCETTLVKDIANFLEIKDILNS